MRPPAPRALASALSAWFPRVMRDLPWRRDRTPYRVWVSEVMLQQTRVETVIRYFEPFLVRFPDVRALAAAPVGEVLSAWSGLGYYRRARALHGAAVQIVEAHGGVLPRTLDGLLSVKGIGPYPAGAVLAFAHDEPAPAVDGNVSRVLARVLAVDVVLTRPEARARIDEAARALAASGSPRVVNEALIELGATVCTPRSPRCEACPLAPWCAARRTGDPTRFPVVVRKRATPVVHAAALVARRDGAVLVGRRGGDGLYAGLWEPPIFEAGDPAAARRALARAATGKHEGHVRHVLTHRTMEIDVVVGAPRPHPAYPSIYDSVRWVREVDLGRDAAYGASTLAMKLLRR